MDFNDGRYFETKRSINLIRPEVRGILGEKFNFFIARKMGLVALDDAFVFLFMNGSPYGLMYEVEHWGKEILEKNRRPEGNLYGENNSYAGATDTSVFRKYPLRTNREWKKYSKDPNTKKRVMDDIQLLNGLMNNDFYDEYSGLVNVDKFIDWSVHSVPIGAIIKIAFTTIVSTLIRLTDGLRWFLGTPMAG